MFLVSSPDPKRKAPWLAPCLTFSWKYTKSSELGHVVMTYFTRPPPAIPEASCIPATQTVLWLLQSQFRVGFSLKEGLSPPEKSNPGEETEVNESFPSEYQFENHSNVTSGGLYTFLEVGSSCLIKGWPLKWSFAHLPWLYWNGASSSTGGFFFFFKESNLVLRKAGIVNQKLCTVRGIGKMSRLPAPTSPVFWHLVSNLENILIVLIFSMTKYKLLPQEGKKKSQIIMITGSRIQPGRQLLLSTVVDIKNAFHWGSPWAFQNKISPEAFHKMNCQ